MLATFYAELNRANLRRKFGPRALEGLNLCLGAQNVHGPRAQPCLNPALGDMSETNTYMVC